MPILNLLYLAIFPARIYYAGPYLRFVPKLPRNAKHFQDIDQNSPPSTWKTTQIQIYIITGFETSRIYAKQHNAREFSDSDKHGDPNGTFKCEGNVLIWGKQDASFAIYSRKWNPVSQANPTDSRTGQTDENQQDGVV